jgi:hypothetical protein
MQDLLFALSPPVPALRAALRLMEQDAKATAGGCFHRPQCSLPEILRRACLGGSEAAVDVRFHRRMSCG